jgi:glycosyltransferase involved in cell wall biosynthesis
LVGLSVYDHIEILMNASADAPAPVISVIIPTFHRPQGARNAVMSILAQQGAPSFEVLLIDNDAAASCAATAQELAQLCQATGVPFTYQIEPEAGVANVRNFAVKRARGAFVAFLDDDEVANPHWLAQMVAAQAATGADVVFGPQEARLPASVPEPRAYFQAFFSRQPEGPTRVIEEAYGCSNSFVRCDTVFVGDAPFDPTTNETGGEDDVLWADVRARGGTFAWAADALVYDDIPPGRATYAYMAKRSFAHGHYTSDQWFRGDQPRVLRGLLAMARGLLQALGMGIVTLVLFAIGHPQRAWALSKMMTGLGKVFWFGPFQMQLYGKAAQKKLKADAGAPAGQDPLH